MIRSLSLRRRCAAASRRASAAAELDVPLDFDAWLRLELDRADEERLDDDRLPVLLRAELAEDRLPELPFAPELDLEAPLLACGMSVSLWVWTAGRVHPTCCPQRLSFTTRVGGPAWLHDRDTLRFSRATGQRSRRPLGRARPPPRAQQPGPRSGPDGVAGSLRQARGPARPTRPRRPA